MNDTDCPTCGKPIDPMKKVWIDMRGKIPVFYHFACRPWGGKA